MTINTDRAFENFSRSFDEFLSSTPLTRHEKASKLASQIDILALTRDGLSFLYDKSTELVDHGLFDKTAWAEPDKLVPALVKGTLRAGHPSSSFEIISELRMLKIATGYYKSELIPEQMAREFLEEVVVHNLEFAFKQLTEESREIMSERDIKKAHNLLQFVMDEIDLHGIYHKLAEEIELSCAQRPIMTRKTRELIKLVYEKFDLSDDTEVGEKIQHYLNAVYHPSYGSTKHPSLEDYSQFLDNANEKMLSAEANDMGHYMNSTGLVSQHHALLLLKLVKEYDHLVPECLDLDHSGKAEWDRYQSLISDLISETVSIDNFQCIYGLSRMMERSLFSRRAVRIGLENLRKIKLNTQVEKRIIKAQGRQQNTTTALQYLVGGTIKVLGQPLGIGQGNNPTCQSARGISIWSQHAPAKLIDMVITVATQNNLIYRFENADLTSNHLAKGLVDKLDYDLDVVSVVLVPHLDKIYNEMMSRAFARGEDPHKWVNPALYSQWIQVGFISAYDYLTNSITDFEGFARIFYAAFHPRFNGNRRMVYPNPVGIIITNSKGEMVGFHAITLLRVKERENGQVRAYFLNPNNEGRQDWGHGVNPTVSGNGEKHGESSLPIDQFVSRIYAFHYNALEVTAYLATVDQEELKRVETMAKESWGKSYNWSSQAKIW
jgi:hypothetical protein